MTKKQNALLSTFFLVIVLGLILALYLLISANIVPQTRTFQHVQSEVVWPLDSSYYNTESISIFTVGGEAYKYSFGIGTTYDGDGYSVRIGEIVSRSEDGVSITITTVARMNVAVSGVYRSVLLVPVKGDLVAYKCSSLAELGIASIDQDFCESTFTSEEVFQAFAKEAKIKAAEYGLTLYSFETNLLANPDLQLVTNPVFTTIHSYSYR